MPTIFDVVRRCICDCSREDGVEGGMIANDRVYRMHFIPKLVRLLKSSTAVNNYYCGQSKAGSYLAV